MQIKKLKPSSPSVRHSVYDRLFNYWQAVIVEPQGQGWRITEAHRSLFKLELTREGKLMRVAPDGDLEPQDRFPLDSLKQTHVN